MSSPSLDTQPADVPYARTGISILIFRRDVATFSTFSCAFFPDAISNADERIATQQCRYKKLLPVL
jgi:hypothetical protein